jgi:hypothetical protein
MTRTNRLLVIFNTLLATILVLVLIQFAPSVANANSTTIVACANKKTGALRIAYKACSKKENNVTWGVTGPQGATGATGAQGATGATGPQGTPGAAGQDRSGYAIAKDANGSRIQNVVDLNWKDVGPIVLKDGLLWTFSKITGEPSAIKGENMTYTDPLCAEGFVLSTGPNIDTTLSPQDTFLFQNHLGITQPETYKIKYELLHEDVGLIYTKEIDGDCVLSPLGPSYFYYLEALIPPASLPAPLTLEFQ